MTLSGGCSTRHTAGESAVLHRRVVRGSKRAYRLRSHTPVVCALAALVFCWAAIISNAHAAEEPYRYPFADPYVATVIGTPHELCAEVPGRVAVREHELKVFKDRPVPNVLWYGEKLRYSVVTQTGEAPLIFLIPGMGAGYNEQSNEFLQRVFFKAGFHVVCLPSPTHPLFITAASKSGVPGHLSEDAVDLYLVMELIMREMRKEVKISGFHLAGYSLGAAQAAFVADLDRQRGLFGFRKVLLVNPPVSLYSSMRLLDDMMKKIPGGEEKFEQFFDQTFKAFAAIYKLSEPVDFTGDFLYRGRKPDDQNLAALIGLSFRLSVANMVFTSDVFTNAGYIKPKNLELSTTDSLTGYFKVADLVRFTDYFRDIFVPYFQEQTPGLTEQQIIDQLALKNIETFLRGSRSIFLFHNADDLILAPGEIDYLRDVFGPRAVIYPHGGHCGNLMYRANVADMLAVFKDEAKPAEQVETREVPPVLSREIAPAPQDSGDAAVPTFTAPRPAAASAEPGSREKGRREITAARRPAVKPGLSYVIDVYDPLEPMNRALYRFNATFDEYLFLPLTRAYEFVTPVFIQDRISGIFSNISDIRNLTNAMLQLRPARTGRIFTRFLINTTLGLGGMWDPATKLGFPRHVEEVGS